MDSVHSLKPFLSYFLVRCSEMSGCWLGGASHGSLRSTSSGSLSISLDMSELSSGGELGAKRSEIESVIH